MSILDRLTDQDLKNLIGQKNEHIGYLNMRIKDLEAALARSGALLDSKMKRIAELSGDLAELRREQSNQENAFVNSMKMAVSQFSSIPGPQAEFAETLVSATKKLIGRLEKEDCHG